MGRPMDRKIFATAAAAFLFLVSSGPLSAQSAEDTACANCHGTNGKSNGKIPTLAGRPAPALAAVMKAFKSETPPPATTIMNRIAKGYTDEQIEALAKYFAEQK